MAVFIYKENLLQLPLKALPIIVFLAFDFVLLIEKEIAMLINYNLGHLVVRLDDLEDY